MDVIVLLLTGGFEIPPRPNTGVVVGRVYRVRDYSRDDKPSRPTSSAKPPHNKFYLYVGTFTKTSSKGIYIYRFDAPSGKLDSIGAETGVKNPSFLAISPDHNNLYAVNEMSDSAKATVRAFTINKTNGRLTFLNKQPSRGGNPCYVSTDDKGEAVFVGNYIGGSLSMFPIDKKNGAMRAPTLTIQHHGSSVNPTRQQKPHVHCTILSPSGSHLYVADLGTDRIEAYPFDRESLHLDEAPSFTYKTKKGAGPRHLTFSPDGQYAYLVTELSGRVLAFKHTENSLKPIQTISNVPDGYSGKISGAEIQVSPNGKFLYASNREDLNNIVIYAIDQANGTLTKVGSHPSGGVGPRYFMIDPTGGYLLSANSKTNNIVVYKRDQKTGNLSNTGNEVSIAQPVCLKMVPAH